MGNLLINLACTQNNYIFMLAMSQTDIDAVRTRHLVGIINPRLRGDIKVLTNAQVSMIQTPVYLQYVIPDSNMRISLSVPISSQMDWVCPTNCILSYIINVEGV